MFTWMTVRHNTEKNALNEESHRSATSQWQNLLNKMVLSTPNHEWGVGIKLNVIAVIGTDGIDIYRITATTPLPQSSLSDSNYFKQLNMIYYTN
jgi:hypothetical protein